jgi:molybdopterin synthase sulfur carrier subunit
MIRVQLPVHLRNLAGTGKIVEIDLAAPVTPERIVDELEARYPALKGGIRDRNTRQRRPMVRYFACEEDFSHVATDTELPAAIASGKEPFIILGAISGGER